MAIAQTGQGGNQTTAPTLTSTFTMTATGSNRILVGITWYGSTGQTVTATYNTTAMAGVNGGASFTPASGTSKFLANAFTLVNPDSGVADVFVATKTATGGDFYSVASSYSGAAQSGQPDNFNTNSAVASTTSLTTSLTTVADNCWTVMGGFSNFAGIAASTGSTLRGSTIGGGVAAVFDSNGVKTPAGSTSMTLTSSSGSGSLMGQCDYMVSIAPVATATTTHFLASMGVGS